MKPLLAFLALCFLAAALPVRADDLTPEDQYFNIFATIKDADALVASSATATAKVKENDLESAKAKYHEAQTALKKMQEDFPSWNVKLVKYRINYLSDRIAALTIPAPAPRKTS